MGARILFAGEEHLVSEGQSVSIGREADLVVDDNPYLHRRFLELSVHDGLVWIENVGSQIAARLSDERSLMHTYLSPGARVPLPLERCVVWFTAGPTTYDFEVVVDDPPFAPVPREAEPQDATTIGQVSLTPDQRLLLVSLAEEFLRRGARGRANIPPSAVAAEKLGWTITKFNRKLDNVCDKLSRQGVQGLVSGGGRNASARRSRLVEYALAVRLVTPEDVPLFEQAVASSTEV